LTTRALNRALLARQMLLKRAAIPVADALEHLVGMQAQMPDSPYVGLWSRLKNFRHAALADLLLGRKAVRVALMRNTLHLVTAEDCLALRPVVQRLLQRAYGKANPEKLAAIVAAGRAILGEGPRTNVEIGRLLNQQFPSHSPITLGYAIRDHLALVQIPPRGVWGQTLAPTLTTAESWLGRPLAASTDPVDMLVRYLYAFGPASRADMTAWSGLPGLQDAAERLRPQLRVFRDERGRELFDVADGLRPRATIAAPVRFLPEYDNVLVAYRDRSRIIPDAYRKRVMTRLGGPPVLVDGFVRGFWRLHRTAKNATLDVELFETASAAHRAELTREGLRLSRFIAPDAEKRVVRFRR
jgi:DNA glycosylase AlkZ-like